MLFRIFLSAVSMDSCSVAFESRGVKLAGATSWHHPASLSAMNKGLFLAGRLLAEADTFTVTADVWLRDSSLDHYVWVGRLTGLTPDTDTVTAELMLANSVRNGVMYHYGGFDMIPGPGTWGVTPERIDRAMAKGDLPNWKGRRLNRAAGVDSPCDVPVVALVASNGRILRAEGTDFTHGAELARRAGAAAAGDSIVPLVFEGKRTSAWLGLVVTVPCGK